MQIFYSPKPANGSVHRWEASFVRVTNAGYGTKPDVHEPAGHSTVDLTTGEIHVEQLRNTVDVYRDLLHNVLLVAKREGLTSAHIDDSAYVEILEDFGFVFNNGSWVIDPQLYRDKSRKWGCI